MTRSHYFDLVSHWRLQAPCDRVWAALTHPQDWPRWWPGLRAVQLLHEGEAGGLGSVRRLTWVTGLGYEVKVDMLTLEVSPSHCLRGRASGMLQGEGIWLLRPQGQATSVTYVWRVELRTPWMRALAPLLAPLFRWNHQRLMAAGGAGLARHLAQQAFSAPAHPAVRPSGG